MGSAEGGTRRSGSAVRASGGGATGACGAGERVAHGGGGRVQGLRPRVGKLERGRGSLGAVVVVGWQRSGVEEKGLQQGSSTAHTWTNGEGGGG